MEKRITEERRLSEESLNKKFDETMENMKDMRKDIHNTNKWIIGLVITAIAAIAAMVLTAFLFK